MRRLIIIGAGGHGRCCLDIAREMKIYDEILFADDGSVGQNVNGVQVFGKVEDVFQLAREDYEVFVAIGNNGVRKDLMIRLKENGYVFANLISPRSCISEYAVLGNGCVIYPNVVIESNVKMGDGCIATSNASINHDAIIGDFCLVYSNSVIRPNVTLENLVRVGSGCVISFGTRVNTQSDISDGSLI